MKSNKINLIFSIVLYNTEINCILKALDSINSLKEDNKSNEFNINKVLIIDNSKKKIFKKELHRFKKLVIVYNHKKENLGYGRGHNFNFNIISKSQIKYFFIAMNPDIKFKSRDILPLFKYLKNLNFSCAAPLIYLENGEIQYSAKKNPTFTSLLISRFQFISKIKFFHSYLVKKQNRFSDYKNEIIKSEFLSGCFLIFNPDIYKKIGGFDEKFFLHFEDADITRRCSEYFACFHYPHAFITHKRGRGSHQSVIQQFILMKSYCRYIIKWGLEIF